MDLIPRTARDAPPKPRWHSSLNIIDNKNEPCTPQKTNSWHYKKCWCLYCRCFSFLSKGVYVISSFSRNDFEKYHVCSKFPIDIPFLRLRFNAPPLRGAPHHLEVFKPWRVEMPKHSQQIQRCCWFFFMDIPRKVTILLGAFFFENSYTPED